MSNVAKKFSLFRERVIESGLKIKEYNASKPWGEYIALEPESTSQFIKLYFPEKEDVLTQNIQCISPKFLFVKPVSKLSWQYHYRRSELWKLIEGEAAIVRSHTDVEGEPEIMVKNELVTIQRLERHRLIGLDSYGIIAEIWQHEDQQHLSNEEDIVRLADDYDRK